MESPPTRGLERMMDQLVHRGPDDRGAWIADGIAFGHRRLSIIDVEGSPQPMQAGRHSSASTERSSTIRLCVRTVEGGYAFQTDGDTEVLLALHRTEGRGREPREWPVRLRRLGRRAPRARAAPGLAGRASALLPLGRARARIRIRTALLPALDDVRVDEESIKEYLAYRSVLRHTRRSLA